MTTPDNISKANIAFALSVFKKLADANQAADVFFSPFSISAALAMVMLGARGNTAAQMSEVLGFTESDKPQPVEGAQPEAGAVPEAGAEPEQGAQPEEAQLEQTAQRPIRLFQSSRGQLRQQMQQRQAPSKLPRYLLKCLTPSDGNDDVHAGFAKLLSELNDPHTDYALFIANKLYGEQSYVFLKNFLDATRKHYSAELESVDFIKKLEAAVLKINTWVEEQTQGKIKELITKDVVDDSTKLVLVNAIYFKGKWQEQFKEEDTAEAPFRTNKNDSKQVKMMRQKTKFPLAFHPDLNLQILELPYQGSDLSMIIMLPKEIEDDTTGLEKLEKALTYETFEEWTRPDMFIKTEVKVSLPRFSLTETYKLKEVLISMGMIDAFSVEMSDFSGMSTRNDLVLSKVVHKAFIDVNKEGTESAAATAAVMTVRSATITETFNADHPFLFFIRHNSSRNILFAGRYCTPE
ncbi:leukocyte elastase inhibitor-like [Nelusetta ayraudi]|uniref:leukocyte elastase inhibitor-like n=1 Tax=Nelusetta ayraudi TaxID=303726 RepID=UPI003F6E523D